MAAALWATMLLARVTAAMFLSMIAGKETMEEEH
jgi:hypothetical protein